VRIFSRNGSKYGYRKLARYSALSLFRHDLENTHDVVIIGGGVHGLSTAWRLAKELKARGRGSGEDVIVLDKTGIAAGASGIACGTVRNNYFQPAMRELMAYCVSVWESDTEAFAYHPVGDLTRGHARGHRPDLQGAASNWLSIHPRRRGRRVPTLHEESLPRLAADAPEGDVLGYSVGR
jgi:glycine/D-amino acid oxidase-like deaminating enzyme